MLLIIYYVLWSRITNLLINEYKKVLKKTLGCEEIIKNTIYLFQMIIVI
nr:MAG TPA: hypothetical protein [Caudoviricetes sp.]